MILNDQDKIIYLANVLLIAYVDKEISSKESAALDEIRKSIDAKVWKLTRISLQKLDLLLIKSRISKI